jgi:hypothetical protein
VSGRVLTLAGAKRLRELAGGLGYRGGKTIFDDYVRELRPRFLVRRT